MSTVLARIRSSVPAFVTRRSRGGVTFGRDWQEIDTGELGLVAIDAILTDPHIEFREGDPPEDPPDPPEDPPGDEITPSTGTKGIERPDKGPEGLKTADPDPGGAPSPAGSDPSAKAKAKAAKRKAQRKGKK